jgi:hypothetical protein
MADLTPEEMLRFVKLERVFLPRIRKQREFLYKADTDGVSATPAARFVHYTSAEAALNIIKSKRLWMRNAMSMSDYSEVHHGLDMLRGFFGQKENLEEFTKTLDSCIPGAAAEAIAAFNSWLSNIQLQTYIASLSEHDDEEDLHGRLSMWRAFGGTTARVAIVINIPWSAPGVGILNLLFSPVTYATLEDAHQTVRDVIASIKANHEFLQSVDRTLVVGNVFNMLLAGATCIKHEGFKEEREWRAIYSPHRNPSAFMETATEIVGGIPQVVHKIPLDGGKSASLADLEFSRIFDRLIIGPTQYAGPMFDAFSQALTKAGIVPTPGKQLVFPSQIPIRT